MSKWIETGQEPNQIKWMEQPYQQQQGAGGIIQQKAAVLLPIAMDNKFYPQRMDAAQQLEAINAKGALACDACDLEFLGKVILEGCQANC